MSSTFFNLPGRRPRLEQSSNKPRMVLTSQLYWLNMSVPFTGVLGENKIGSTLLEQFPLLIRGAWSNLTDPRVRLSSLATGIPLSTLETPLLQWAGNSDLVNPMLYWRKPYLLKANSGLRGEFINDGTEAAGRMVFLGDRPDRDITVRVTASESYGLLLNLGLDGQANSVGVATTQQLDYDILIYGALSTATGLYCKFIDTRENIGWSNAQLPIGAFSGIKSNPQPIMHYARPYYLRKNSSIRCEFTNAGAETGQFLTFLCERILA